jgi:hypothetical protein
VVGTPEVKVSLPLANPRCKLEGGTGFIWLRAGTREYSNEPSGSKKRERILIS